MIRIDLPDGNDGSGLTFRPVAGGPLIMGYGIGILVQGPDAAGLTLQDVDIA